MKLDKNTVRSLSEMSDDRLWRTLKMIASGMGADISERQRYRLDYEAIRRTLSDITENDIYRINEIMDLYKRHKYERKGGGFR